MKIEVNRVEALKVLSMVQGFTAKKDTEPILQQAKLVSKEGSIEIIGTNLEVAIRSKLNATVLEEGQILVPCEKVVQILRESKEELVNIDTDGNFTKVSLDGANFKLNTGDVFQVSEFPEIDPKTGINNGEPFKISATRLIEMLSKVSFCTAKESSRYTLNGVLFHLSSGMLTLVATDGKRLALASESIENANEIKVVVPDRSLALLKSIPHEELDASITIGTSHVWIKIGDTEVRLNILEGRFPKYQDLLVEDKHAFIKCISTKTKELLSKVKLANLLLREQSKKVFFKAQKNRLELRASGIGIGESDISLDATANEEITFCVNPDYLIDILKSWEGEEVVLKLKDSDSAMFISDASLTYLIMPISLKE